MNPSVFSAGPLVTSAPPSPAPPIPVPPPFPPPMDDEWFSKLPGPKNAILKKGLD